MVLGLDPYASALPPAHPSGPIEALRQCLIEALETAPCLVQFSGGRDSSCALALAFRVAREEGLPLPVPITYRFPAAPEVDESYWQEMIVRHIGVDDWIRLEFTDDLDYVGPVAQRAMRSVGLIWPANGHMLVPALDGAREGTLVTGMDGDGLFNWRWAPAVNMIARRDSPSLEAFKNFLYYLTPSLPARLVDGRRTLHRLSWMRPEPRREVLDRWSDQRAREPRRWDKRVHFYNRMRYASVLRWGGKLLAEQCGANVVHLFMDPSFLSSLAKSNGPSGFRDRTTSLKELFSDLVPEALLERRDKPVFHLYWGELSRRFADEWRGEGVDPDIVDHDRLWSEWHSPYPSFMTALLLQSAWLAREDGIEETIESRWQ